MKNEKSTNSLRVVIEEVSVRQEHSDIAVEVREEGEETATQDELISRGVEIVVPLLRRVELFIGTKELCFEMSKEGLGFRSKRLDRKPEATISKHLVQLIILPSECSFLGLPR